MKIYKKISIIYTPKEVMKWLGYKYPKLNGLLCFEEIEAIHTIKLMIDDVVTFQFDYDTRIMTISFIDLNFTE